MNILITPEITRAIRNHHYERGPQGLYLPRQRLLIGGEFTHELIRNGQLVDTQTDHNLMVNEGLDHVLNVLLRGTAQVATWYVGLFKGNYTPVSTLTAATITSAATEATEYTQATRVGYVPAAPSGQSVSNTASKATFDINNTVTLYGAFLISVSTKSGTTGTLLCASRFAAQRDLVSTDQLLITYTLTAANNV